jgi:hypothetical protein
VIGVLSLETGAFHSEALWREHKSAGR